MIKRYNIDQSMSDDEEVETNKEYFDDTWCKHEDVKEVEDNLLDAYKAITEGHIDEYFNCEYCSESVDMEFQGHNEDCIVIKAANYINTHS